MCILLVKQRGGDKGPSSKTQITRLQARQSGSVDLGFRNMPQTLRIIQMYLHCCNIVQSSETPGNTVLSLTRTSQMVGLGNENKTKPIDSFNGCVDSCICSSNTSPPVSTVALRNLHYVKLCFVL